MALQVAEMVLPAAFDCALPGGNGRKWRRSAEKNSLFAEKNLLPLKSGCGFLKFGI